MFPETNLAIKINKAVSNQNFQTKLFRFFVSSATMRFTTHFLQPYKMVMWFNSIVRATRVVHWGDWFRRLSSIKLSFALHHCTWISLNARVLCLEDFVLVRLPSFTRLTLLWRLLKLILVGHQTIKIGSSRSCFS